MGYLGSTHRLENVQRRWTKQVAGLRDLDYRGRLEALDLFSVRGRLLRADLIKYYKTICSTDEVPLSELFSAVPDRRTRGHKFKVVLPLCATEMRKKFFNVRRVLLWNSLPSYIVEAENVSTFKRYLVDHLKDEMYEFH